MTTDTDIQKLYICKTFFEKYSYDAWGRRRNPANWADYNVKTPRLLNRGYTGHEMLDAFGLINMNGRMYDPVIGRILSPDPFVSTPSYTQGYNRYSYCLNNPLRYTDPSGYNQREIPIYNWNYQDLSERGSGGGSSIILGYMWLPGSGNHWSDAVRSEYGNYMVMSSNTFDSRYGDGASAIAGQLMSDPAAFNAWQQQLISTNSVRQVGYMGPTAGLTGEPGKSVVDNQYGTWVYSKESVWVQTKNKLDVGTVGKGVGGLSSPRDFANELKYFYKQNSGNNYHLSQERFFDIYDQAHQNSAIEWSKAKRLSNGNYKIPVNLYQTKYDFAFGRATMYFSYSTTSGFQPVGFYDIWDLDPKSWGTRSYSNEAITRFYNWQLNGGTPFEITYP